MSGRNDRIGDVVVYGKDGSPVTVTASGEMLVQDTSGVGGVTNSVISLTSLNVDLTGAGSAEHAGIDTSTARRFSLAGQISKTGTPTDVRLEVRCATNTSTSLRFPYQRDFWGDLRWTDQAVGGGLKFWLDGPVEAPAMSVFATMTGTNTFTLSNMQLFLKD